MMEQYSLNSTEYPVFTIGHSNHSPETFLQLLTGHGVEEVVDVRSSPHSRYSPQYNYDVLTEILDQAGISYVFLGGELGGRPVDRSCYDAEGRVLYDRLADTDFFNDGIGRLIREADERRMALMCTEHEPLACHRAVLIAKALVERGVAVNHILADGSLEKHAITMGRLLDSFNLPHNGDLFRSPDEVLADAITRQAKKIAYVGKAQPVYREAWEDMH